MRAIAIILTLLLLTTACTGDDESADTTEESGDSGLAGDGRGDDDAGDGGDDTGRDATTDGGAGREEADEAGESDDGAMNEPIQEADDEMAEDAVAAEAPAADAATGALGQPLPPAPVPTRPDDIDEPLPPVETINPWVVTADDAQSTFGLDVDTISYSRIREALEQGGFIDPSGVRVEEVVNAFDYGYDADDDQVFTVTAEGGIWPWSADDDERHLLRVGVTTPLPDERQPTDLVFVIDTSGSMSGVLPLVQDSLEILVQNLDRDDTVAIVEYSDNARPLLETTRVADEDRILDVIDDLETGGSTNLADGLVTGYQLAEDASREGRTSRVIILSDGIANVGATDPEAILEQIEEAGDRGINLLTVGFGLNGFNDPLMEQLADRGDGFAAYVDTTDEARQLFGEDLTTTLQTVAVEARSQIEFNPDVVEQYRLIGYENRDIADDDFRDDSVDAGEIGAGHSVTAVYEVELTGRTSGSLATVSLRWLDPETREATEIASVINPSVVDREWEDVSAGLRLTGAVTAWAELLRESPYASDEGLEAISREADRIASALDDPMIDEWASLVAVSAR